jgi:hypothetical protein
MVIASDSEAISYLLGLPRLRAATPACTKRFGEGRQFGVQARRFAPRNDYSIPSRNDFLLMFIINLIKGLTQEGCSGI